MKKLIVVAILVFGGCQYVEDAVEDGFKKQRSGSKSKTKEGVSFGDLDDRFDADIYFKCVGKNGFKQIDTGADIDTPWIPVLECGEGQECSYIYEESDEQFDWPRETIGVECRDEMNHQISFWVQLRSAGKI